MTGRISRLATEAKRRQEALKLDSEMFSTHRFDMVEKLCSRVVILSKGRVAAERDMASFRDERSESLEDVFVQTTGQDDFAPVARQILDLMQP